MWVSMDLTPSVKRGNLDHFLMTFECKKDGHRWVREVAYLNEYRLDCDEHNHLYEKFADEQTEEDGLIPFTGWFWECVDLGGDRSYQEVAVDDQYTKSLGWCFLPPPMGSYV
jgi:hypothetical protein